MKWNQNWSALWQLPKTASRMHWMCKLMSQCHEKSIKDFLQNRKTHEMLMKMYGREVVSKKMCLQLVQMLLWHKGESMCVHSRLNVGVTVLKHPPHSPDLASADFVCSLSLRMKDLQFGDILDIQARVISLLWVIVIKVFAEDFQQLYNCYQKCIAFDEHYLEDQ